MNIYGKQEFAIVYYNPTEIIYLSDVPITSKYTFNIEDQIKLKNLDGDRVNLLKGYHHKFEISIHDTDGTLYTLFKDAQQYQVRFYPHQDVDNYYTCNCILVKPIYVKNNVNKDGLNLVFETDSYQDLLNAKTKRVIHEAWNLEDIGEVGLNGASYATTGVFSFPTGKIGNCIKFPAGNNYFKFENWAWAIGDKSFTLNFWTKFDATAGYGDLMGIGTANLAAQTVRLTKNPSNGNGTVNLSLTVQGLTRATDVVLDEDVWHLVTITVGGGVEIYINNILEWQAGYTTDCTWIFMGQGIDTKTFDAQFDELLLIIGQDLTGDGVEYWWNGGAGRSFTNTNFWY